MQNNLFTPSTRYVIHIFIILLMNLFVPFHAWSSSQLRVGISRSNPPFSFVAENDSTPQGFCADLANLLAENMGMNAEVHAMEDAELVKSLISGRVDIIIGNMDNSYSAHDIPYIETTINKIQRKLFVSRGMLSINSYKDLAGRTVAIEKGRDLSWLISSDMKVDFIQVDSTDKALALINSGKAQAYISNNLVSTIYSIQKNGFQNIKEIGDPIETVSMVIAVDKTKPELLTSVSMAYGKILENRDYFTIYNKWFGNDFKYYTSHYIKSILSFVGLSTLALLVFIFWNYMLKSKVILITKDLQRSEKKYRDLIESSPDMIHLISPAGEIILANKIALSHLGYNENEMASLRLQDLILPEQTGKTVTFIEKVFRDGYSRKEFTFRAKGGRSIQVEMVATIVTDADPVEKLACCFSRDLTERKRLEENLLYSDRLAIMGQMAAGIAHEINNPLGIILSHAQDALYHDLKSEDSLESLKSIERNAIRAAKIIEDMLNFTRPAPLQLNPVDLPLQIDSSLFLLKQKLKQKNIKVEKEYPVGPVILSGDENLIQQLLINIILNSIQAIKNDGVINFSIRAIGDDGNKRITLEIKDNGIGIPEEDLQNIFNPFFTSRKENGFGMGLFISKIIVEKHHGDLSVKSKLGEGTTMIIEIPAETIKAGEPLRIS